MKRADRQAADRAADTQIPFSRPYLADSVRDGGDHVIVTAEARECALLAAEFGLEGIAGLSAHFDVQRQSRAVLRVTGEVRAKVTQQCVVTLELFDADVVTPVNVRFAPPEDRAKAEARAAALLKAAQDRGPGLGSDDDPPDEIIDNTVDLGALAAEFLGLALDPYPRKPGAEFAALIENSPGAPAAPAKVSPFAILKNARPEDK